MPNKCKISQAKCLEVQKELTGSTDKVMSTLALSNVIAAIKGWPEIIKGQPNCRGLSQQYIVRYLSSRGIAKNINASEKRVHRGQ